MLPIINIFGYEIATYGICVFLGLLIGAFLAIMHFSKYNNVSKEDTLYCILYAVIGLGVGAKLLYIITNIPFLIQNYQRLDFWTTAEQLLKGGFVFYVGLIGGVLGIFIYAKQFKISFKSLILTLVPVFPLIHSIGRLGCFLAGCCYGMEYHGFGHVVFHNTIYAPVNIPLFPSQIIESLCNFIIFILIICTYKKFKGTYKIIGLYAILYSIVRFTLEFFRGDLIRGFSFGLSTSQWFSIVLFVTGIVIFYKEHKKGKIKA